MKTESQTTTKQGMKVRTHIKAGAAEPTSLTFNGRGIDLNADSVPTVGDE